MAEKRLLAVPAKLVEKIDKHRGDLGRAEFLNLCIDELLKEGREEAEERREFVKREEFDRFKFKTGLQGGELGKATSASRLNEKEGSPFKGAYALWIPGILLFGFGDTFTTTLSAAAGTIEANPILSLILGSPFGVLGFVLVKTAILVGLVLLSSLSAGKHRLAIPGLLTLVGAYLTANNLFFLLPR